MYGHYYIDVTTNFCKVMGMKIVSGEDFLPSDSILHNDLNFIATQDLQQKPVFRLAQHWISSSGA